MPAPGLPAAFSPKRQHPQANNFKASFDYRPQPRMDLNIGGFKDQLTRLQADMEVQRTRFAV